MVISIRESSIPDNKRSKNKQIFHCPKYSIAHDVISFVETNLLGIVHYHMRKYLSNEMTQLWMDLTILLRMILQRSFTEIDLNNIYQNVINFQRKLHLTAPASEVTIYSY